jgi:hypothetical protein
MRAQHASLEPNAKKKKELGEYTKIFALLLCGKTTQVLRLLRKKATSMFM